MCIYVQKDYHPDLGVQCLPFHVTSTSVVQHWRGIRFLQAMYDRSLTLSNTLYVPVSRSQLSNVEIRWVYYSIKFWYYCKMTLKVMVSVYFSQQSIDNTIVMKVMFNW